MDQDLAYVSGQVWLSARVRVLPVPEAAATTTLRCSFTSLEIPAGSMAEPEHALAAEIVTSSGHRCRARLDSCFRSSLPMASTSARMLCEFCCSPTLFEMQTFSDFGGLPG